MNTFFALILLILSFFFIGKSADFIIKGLANLGKRLGWSEFVIGFLVLGLATSTPEIFVSINSGLDGVPQMSLGNLLGGVVVLFTLLIGLNSLLQGTILTDNKFSSINIFRFLPDSFPFGRPHFFVKDLFLMAVVILFPLFLLWDKYLSRADGLILIGAYLFFIIHAIYDKRMQGWEPPIENVSWKKITLWIISGLIGLIFFSWVIVEQGVFLAESWNIKPFVIGLLLLAVGTNIPELSLTFRGSKANGEVVIGDILGSAMANIFIIGLLAVLFPFRLTVWQPLIIVSVILMIATFTLITFLRTKNRLERWEGAVLILIYLIYLGFEISRF